MEATRLEVEVLYKFVTVHIFPMSDNQLDINNPIFIFESGAIVNTHPVR